MKHSLISTVAAGCVLSLSSLPGQLWAGDSLSQPAAPAVVAPAAAAAPVVADPAPAAVPTLAIAPAPILKPAVKRPDAGNAIKSTTLESIQVSHEPGAKPEEFQATWYIICKEKPASYFYELKQKEKKLVFEFNDTRSITQIPQVSESPISKFVVEQRSIDANKDIRGLKAEFHSQVRVTFSLDNIPDLSVSDHANVIQISYKWTTNSKKVGDYVLKKETRKPTPYIIGGAAAALVGVGAVLVTHKSAGTTSSEQPLDATGLPDHPAH